MSVKRVVVLGFATGIVGVAAQLPMLKLGLMASGSLRGMVSLVLAIAIGFITGTWAPKNGVKAAALAGVIAGTMFSLIGFGAVLMDPSVIGQKPLDSPEAFFLFVSSLITSTVIVSWLVAGVSALVALPVSLSRVAEMEYEQQGA